MNAVSPQGRPHQPYLLPFFVAEQLPFGLFRFRQRFSGG
jgi:hypothetical protein